MTLHEQVKITRAELVLTNAALTEQVSKLNTDLLCANKIKDSYYNANREFEEELEQLHGLLDGMEGAGGRKTEHEESYYRKDRKAMTRLAAWLASKVFINKGGI